MIQTNLKTNSHSDFCKQTEKDSDTLEKKNAEEKYLCLCLQWLCCLKTEVAISHIIYLYGKSEDFYTDA